MSKYFTQSLLQWHRLENDRSLPWKEEKDPYKIWLSEIILQQTRAAQGLPYYEKFIANYPTIIDLANAPEEQVFKDWQGLGYYARCRNLMATARMIRDTYQGVFPNTHEEILSLKGIGPYTAAAIASFAFQLPHAVLDGNVFRVIARFFNQSIPIDSTQGKKWFEEKAQSLLDVEHPAAYNQAIMDFGAMVCKPALPLCDNCVLQQHCAAFRQNTVNILPIKEKKITIQTRHFHQIILKFQDEIWVRKRVEKDIWKDLHEFYMIENEEKMIKIEDYIDKNIINKILIIDKKYQQKLTHRTILTRFYIVNISEKLNELPMNGEWCKLALAKNKAYPKTIVSFLNENPYF